MKRVYFLHKNYILLMKYGINTQKTSGFTLIELLTVIAIIGILAGILIPVVSNVRNSAFNAQSISNLRSMQLANNMYANENNGKYLAIWNVSSDGNGQNTTTAWYENPEYLEILLSVSDAASLDGEWPKALLSPFVENEEGNSVASSYGMNRTPLEADENRLGRSGKSIHDFESPNTTVAFGDCTDWILDIVTDNLGYRYKSTANVVFYDASVGACTQEEANSDELAHWWDGTFPTFR